MRFSRSARCLLPGLLFASACGDNPAQTGRPRAAPPLPLGVYEIAVDGIGGTEPRASILPARAARGARASLSVAGSGLVFEQTSSSSFTDGPRTGGGQRYITFTFRVRNGTGAPVNNLTMLLVSRPGNFAGTSLSLMRRFDLTDADPAIAPFVVPTGATAVGGDLASLQALYPDVIQVLQEAEVAAIPPPGDVTGIFPTGYVVRGTTSAGSRVLPATANPNDFSGVLTLSFRLPLQASSAGDVFSLTFQVLAVQDTETRLTESVEEAQDSVAVRHLRERAAALGATTVTVLAGSPAAGADVADYPGQRQICSVRTAGPAGSPTTLITTPANASRLAVLRPGESAHPCAASFRTGSASVATPGTPYPLTVAAMDRYGNVRAVVDTVSLAYVSGPAVTLPGPAALAGGTATLSPTYGAAGTSVLAAVGVRNRGSRVIEVGAGAPAISGANRDTLVTGDTVVFSGSGFNPTPAANSVVVGGLAATVTASTPTALSVVVPCVPTGTASVQVTQGGMAGASAFFPARVRSRSALAVGQSVVLDDPALARCSELAATGVSSRYFVAVYNAGLSPSASTAFEISGNAAGEPLPPAAAEATARLNALMRAPVAAAAPAPRFAAERAAGEARHLQVLEQTRAEYRRLFARFGNRPDRASPAVRRDVVLGAPPLSRTFRIGNLNATAPNNYCTSYYVASATRVYWSGKVAIYEDDATPAALKGSANAAMAGYYQKIGDQFNADMEPIVRNNFGDILRRDAVTDANGVMVALFTPRINTSFPSLAGFVSGCDYFPNDDANTPPVGGPYTGSAGSGNASSNFGEFFYAYQPVVNGSGYYGGLTPDSWYWSIRGTFVHESKHVASLAARVANGAPVFEESWLEEGSARHAEELWVRNSVFGLAWKGNTGYGGPGNPVGLYCEVRPTGSAECAANPRAPTLTLWSHFTTLYTFMSGTNARLMSPFGRTPSDGGFGFYASSWSLVRYAIDRYGASDAAFLTALTQSSTSGATNLAARAGVPIGQLLGGWALALAADDYPGMGGSNPDVRFATWNFRNVYAGLNTDYSGSFPLAYPLTGTSLGFGGFGPVSVSTMYGGSVLWYQLSGVQTSPQLLRLAASGGGAPSTNLRVAVVRVQ
jgi:hypothetical protein